MYTTATNLKGPWSKWKTFANPGTRTYYSQISSVVSIKGVVMWVLLSVSLSHKLTQWRLMGDSWSPQNLMSSTYLWLPLIFSSKNTVSMVYTTENPLFGPQTHRSNIFPPVAISTKLDSRSCRWKVAPRAPYKQVLFNITSTNNSKWRY